MQQEHRRPPLAPQGQGTGVSVGWGLGMSADTHLDHLVTGTTVFQVPLLKIESLLLVGATMLECGYRNERAHLVILCCIGAGGFRLERVIFPFELLTFHAPEGAMVLVYGPTSGDPELLEECGADTLLLGLRSPDPHPLLPASMEAMLQDLRRRYALEPSPENRQRLTQLEQSLVQHLPGLAWTL
jgi:hypothetical protein